MPEAQIGRVRPAKAVATAHVVTRKSPARRPAMAVAIAEAHAGEESGPTARATKFKGTAATQHLNPRGEGGPNANTEAAATTTPHEDATA